MVFWHEGPIGVDGKIKVVLQVAATPTSVHDSHVLEGLPHGDKTCIWGCSEESHVTTTRY